MERPEKILVVDDEPNFVEVLRTRLEAAGYEVAEAAEGKDAIEIIAGSKIDLILLDIVMPGMDGYTFLHRLRSEADTRRIPVIVITGKPELKDIFRIEGVHAVLDKLCDDDILMREIRKALDANMK